MSRLFFLLALFTNAVLTSQTDRRIVGGNLTKPGQIPYQVSLRRSYNDHHFCAGSIITPRHVLTAAHCCFYAWGGVLPPMVVKVVAGQRELKITNETISRKVTKIIVHPEYDSHSMANDVAIVELEEPLVMGRMVEAVALNRRDNSTNLECTVSGWGVLSFGSFTSSEHLLVTNVTVLDRQECQKRYNLIDAILEDGMLCAVNDQRPADASQGDSGGPLVCEGQLTGVISTGKECANSSFPGIYSDVKFFLPWIEETIKVPFLLEVETTTRTVETTTALKENQLLSWLSLFSSSPLKQMQQMVVVFVILVIFENVM